MSTNGAEKQKQNSVMLTNGAEKQKQNSAILTNGAGLSYIFYG